MNQRSRWKDHDHWSCLGHVPPISLPATAARCYMVGCSTRPSDELRPEPMPEPEPVATESSVVYIGLPGTERCAYDACHNAAREGSKYCSRACSNRNARKRHKVRKAA